MVATSEPQSRPRPGPGVGRDLSVEQELACALRILAHEGWQENMSGHITWVADEPGRPSMWVNPWGKWWQEVRASDIVRVDVDGQLLSGRWDVTPAVFLHTELHRARADARVIVHGHPYYATVLAGIGELPRIIHQNSCIFDGELGLVHEYDGSIENASAGARLADRVGAASGVLLVNHGAIVTAPTIQEACYKAACFERMCRFTYDTLVTGREPLPIDPTFRAEMKVELRRNAPQPYWDGAVRSLVAAEPDVLQ